MGLRISVYRDADGHDSTNGGISSHVKNLTVVNADGPFEPNADAPAVLIEEGYRSTVRLVPAIFADGKWVRLSSQTCSKTDFDGVVGPMFGGNYAATSDSRFREAIEKITGGSFYGAVAIHDRYESADLNAYLSR
jgi:hypothetical protein